MATEVVLGDGIRRNIATVSAEERNRLRDAIKQLHLRHYAGARSDIPTGGVSYWFKQDEIHQATHVHHGPEFLPWHRELVNRFEALIREVDPELSLHYWDWTTDPHGLFTSDFMGSPNGQAGEPWASAGFYDPAADPYRADNPFDTAHSNPFDPPKNLTRNLPSGGPVAGGPGWPTDSDILGAATFPEMRLLLEDAHDNIHGYIGGTIGNPHTSFRDPFVFLLHSNVDRLFATWQAAPGHPERLEPDTVYGTEGTAPSSVLNNNLEPWAGGTGTRPWSAPENQPVIKNYKHPSIVAPPCYDTLPSVVSVNEVMNPGSIIHFNDVPSGETTARAAVFRVYSCADVTLEVKPGSGPVAPYSVLTPSGSITVHHGSQQYTEARIWFGFTGGAAGSIAPTGNVIIRCVQTGKEYPFTLTGNSIARPTVAVVLTLDQSGSMDDAAGTLGAKRIEVLRQAASQFIGLIQPNNGVGIIRFDTDAYPVGHPTYPGLAVTQIGMGGMFDPARVAALNAVTTHHTNLSGMTAIGDGIEMARNTINPAPGYDHKAIIVFTDGLETAAKYISDVLGLIDNRTFAIGLGSETQVATEALRRITNNTGGYVLLTGELSASTDDYFRLSKYFLQILAGVTNTSIVVDPNGFIAPGTKVKIPFVLNEADIDGTVILLTDIQAVRMSVVTPNGDLIDPVVASSIGATYAVGNNLVYYRFNLPVPLGKGAHRGIWNAILEVDDNDFKKQLSRLENNPAALRRARAHGARYSVNVHSFSNLRMDARLLQSSLVPGASMTLHVVLTEYGLPVERRAVVHAEVQKPDTTTTNMPLKEIEPGVFEASLIANLQGIYHFRILASGGTMRGSAFTREQHLTGAVFQGGDDPLPSSSDDPRQHDSQQLCRLLECVIKSGALKGFFSKYQVDPETLLKCIQLYCSSKMNAGEGTKDSAVMFGEEIRRLIGEPKIADLLSTLLEFARKSKT